MLRSGPNQRRWLLNKCVRFDQVATVPRTEGRIALLSDVETDVTDSVSFCVGLGTMWERQNASCFSAVAKAAKHLLSQHGEVSAPNRVHYLDITGEIDVFEALPARDAEAKARGVMLLPGVGFDVVPSDCLAAHLKRRLPDANDLRLYLSLGANMSRGTAKNHDRGNCGWRPHAAQGPNCLSRSRGGGSCDFGEGEKPTVQVSFPLLRIMGQTIFYFECAAVNAEGDAVSRED